MKDSSNVFSEGFKDPFKQNPYVDPFKAKEYKDPLRVPKGSFKDPLKTKKLKIPEFRPYDTIHEYKFPNIDPLTGKPYRKGAGRHVKKKEEPKKPNGHVVPVPKSYFPPQLGSTVGSTKRMLKIQENLNF